MLSKTNDTQNQTPTQGVWCRLQRFVMWITGFKPDIFYDNDIQNDEYKLFLPTYLFDYTPVGDWSSLSISIYKAPNVLHRALQRICFGVKYKMTKAT